MRIHHSAPYDPAGLVNHTHRRPLETNVQSCKHPLRCSPSFARGITSGKGRLPAGEQQPHVWDVLLPHDYCSGSALSVADIDDFVSDSDGLRMIGAFMRIDNAALRRRIVMSSKKLLVTTTRMPWKCVLEMEVPGPALAGGEEVAELLHGERRHLAAGRASE